jgi:hypothetical protein
MVLQILSRQAPALSSRWMEFHLDAASFGQLRGAPSCLPMPAALQPQLGAPPFSS